MKISNETKVGTLAVISITILILGYNFMKGENLFTSYNRYFAQYDDVELLFKSNPVMINGYKIGQVSDVQMDQKSLKLLVEIKVPKSIKVPKDAIIKIINTDLIGSKGVQIIMGKSHEIAKSGDTLSSDKDQGMAKAMTKLITPLSEKINILLTELNAQLGNNQIKTTLQNLDKTLVTADQAIKKIEAQLDSKNAKMDDILSNVNSVSYDLKSSTPKINAILTNFQSTSEELKKMELESTAKQLKKTLTDMSLTIDNINKGNGALGQLATNDELYKKFNATLESFKKLAEDIEKYPGRYTGITKSQRKKAEKAKKLEKKN